MYSMSSNTRKTTFLDGNNTRFIKTTKAKPNTNTNYVKYSKLLMLPIAFIALGLNILHKWVASNVQMTIQDGERLDELVMIGFLTSTKKLFVKINAEHKEPITPSAQSSLWTPENDALLIRLAQVYANHKHRWKFVSQNFQDITSRQCSARWEELQPIQSIEQDHRMIVNYIKKKENSITQNIEDGVENQKKNNTHEKIMFGEILKRTFRKLHYHASTKTMQARIGLINHLVQKIPRENVLEFLKGGHAIVNDKGEMYVRIVTTDGSHPRISSHYPQFKNAPHYGITVRMSHLPTMHILAGIVRRQNKNVTWIQLESSPMPSLFRLFSHEGAIQNVTGIIKHMKDYLAHSKTKKQYGPLGASWYSEKGDKPNVIYIR